MNIWFWGVLASTATAVPSGEPQTANEGPELLRREHAGSPKQRLAEDAEQPRRATMNAAYVLTEKQMQAAHGLGRAIGRQSSHEKERMLNVLQAIIDHAEARIQEHHKMYPDHKGPVSLVQEGRFPSTDVDEDELDTVPQRKIRPIGHATPESLAQESAGWVPPPNWNPEAMPEYTAFQAPAYTYQSSKTPGSPPNHINPQSHLPDQHKKQGHITTGPELPPDLSAFERDNNEGNEDLSEYFGPFRMDYENHRIDCVGWNFVVSSPNSKPGLGNLLIGQDNFVTDATNSFVMGIHNTARGEDDAIVAGQDNEAVGTGNSVIGGAENIAEGQYSSVAGGYRQESTGFYNVASGGAMNVATGTFNVVAGGQNNFAQGSGASITGGRGNEALGTLSSITGGAGNKVSGKHATVVGGVGLEANENSVALWNKMDEQDREEVASRDFSKSHHGDAVHTIELNLDYDQAAQ